MRRLSRVNSSIVHVKSIGRTYEGRNMYLIRVKYQDNNHNQYDDDDCDSDGGTDWRGC